jgi:hypothetical protein
LIIKAFYGTVSAHFVLKLGLKIIMSVTPPEFNNESNNELNAEKIIDSFGGIRPMSTKTGIAVTTIQGWKKRGVIPAARYDEIIKASKENNISIDLSKAIDKKAVDIPSAPLPSKSPSMAVTIDQIIAEKESKEKRAGYEKVEAVTEKTIEIKTNPTHSYSQPQFINTPNNPVKQAQSLQITAKIITLSILSSLSTCALIAVILWPHARDIYAYNARLKLIEQDMIRIEDSLSEIREDQSRLPLLLEEMQKKTLDKVSSLDASPFTQRLNQLEQTITQITGSKDVKGLVVTLQKLQESVEGQEKLSKIVDSLKETVTNLEGKFSNLNEALTSAQKEKNTLGETLSAVKKDNLQEAALLIGLTQLRDSLNRNAPFSDDLALLQSLLPKENTALSQAIEELKPFAKTGVLSPQSLVDELNSLKGKALSTKEGSLAKKTASSLNNLVLIEKNGVALNPNAIDLKIESIESDLVKGDLSSAVVHLDALDSTTKQDMAGLIEKTKASLKAQNIQEILSKAILDQLAHIQKTKTDIESNTVENTEADKPLGLNTKLKLDQ